MARLLSHTLIRASSSSSSHALSPRILTSRHRSNQSGKPQFIEVDVNSSNDDVEVFGIRKLEDVIHNIIVKRSAPDWLPFMPGSSYWVPPRSRRPHGVVELLEKLPNPLTDEESFSLSTVRGWPSSSYFIPGTPSTHPVEVKVEVMVLKDLESASQSEDEEG